MGTMHGLFISLTLPRLVRVPSAGFVFFLTLPRLVRVPSAEISHSLHIAAHGTRTMRGLFIFSNIAALGTGTKRGDFSLCILPRMVPVPCVAFLVFSCISALGTRTVHMFTIVYYFIQVSRWFEPLADYNFFKVEPDYTGNSVSTNSLTNN